MPHKLMREKPEKDSVPASASASFLLNDKLRRCKPLLSPPIDGNIIAVRCLRQAYRNRCDKVDPA